VAGEVVNPDRFPRGWRQAAVIAPLARGLRLWYRPRVHGLERVPRDRPVVLVGKHPRTWLYLETVLLGHLAFWDGSRPAFRPMEKRDTSLHRLPGVRWLRRNVGAIEASSSAALAALRGGESVLLFPGGARELYGPRDRIAWVGRTGFARIAARAGAPVVPFAIAGADAQHPLRLELPRRGGARRSLWLPPVPLPVRLEYHFGAPLSPPRDPEDRAALAAFAREVEGATAGLLARATGAGRAR
jgi:1-acyl-sn-glycerol-3-phosphate acyltransferase